MIIAIFWVGFFVLEGFDFGVGVLHTIVGRTETERRVAINTIGPFWDGNEVWLVVAGAGMFAAFPGWYATMFSALYLALLLVLVALIARGVSFEYYGKSEDPRWRSRVDVVHDDRQPADPVADRRRARRPARRAADRQEPRFHRQLLHLLTPYGIWTGLTLLGLCLLHGATFLKLKTTDVVRERARAIAAPLGWAAIAARDRSRDLDDRGHASTPRCSRSRPGRSRSSP